MSTPDIKTNEYFEEVYASYDYFIGIDSSKIEYLTST
jgi:hypothetical protein